MKFSHSNPNYSSHLWAFSTRNLLIITLLILTVSGLLSCKKNDIIKPLVKNPVEEKFFTVPTSTASEVQALSKSIIRQNEQHQFIEALVKRAGFPIWDKAKVIKSETASQGSRPSGSSDGDLIFIPFVKDSQNYVNSILIVKTGKKDTTFRMLYANQYRQFGFDTTNTAKWNAKDVFNLFALFDNAVFGHNKFLIKDTRLFKSKKDSANVVVSMQNTASTAGRTMSYAWVCITWEVCDQMYLLVRSTSDIPNCYKSHDETRCLTYFTYDGGGVVGYTGTNDGTGSTGGGSAGSNGWYSDPTTPCPPTTPPYQERATNVVPCDGSTGWEPVPEKDANGYYYKRIAELQFEIQKDPYFLIGCKYLEQFKALGNFQSPQEVLNKIAQLNQAYNSNPLTYYFIGSPFFIQNINDGVSEVVNCDYFPIYIKSLPTVNGVQWTAEQLFDHFRRNLDQFVDGTLAKFSPYEDAFFNDKTVWESANPLTAMLHLNMVEDGSVIISKYNTSSDNVQMIASTLRTPLDLHHPVSGNRSWGIFKNSDPAIPGYTFYTSAVDRITSPLPTVFNTWAERFGVQSGYDKGDALWRSLQDKMIEFINRPEHGGNAEKFSATPEIILRPQWVHLERFLKNQISLAELKSLLGC